MLCPLVLLKAVDDSHSSVEVVGVWVGMVVVTRVELVSHSPVEVVGVWTGFVVLTSVEVVQSSVEMAVGLWYLVVQVPWVLVL